LTKGLLDGYTVDMKLLITSILVATMIVAPVAVGEWSVEGGNIRRSGVSTDILIPPLMVTKSLNIGSDVSDVTNCTPVVSDGILVIGTHNGMLYGVDTKHLDGPNWKKENTSKNDDDLEVYRSSACIDGDRVYIGDRLGHMTCWNLRDGKFIWQKRFDGWITSSPIITVDDKLIFGTNEGYVYSVNKMNGKQFSNGKSKQLIGPIYGITCSGEDDDRIFVGCGGDNNNRNSRNLYCLNTVNLKKQKWSSPKDVNGSILSNPVIDNNRLFVISTKTEESDNEGSGISKSYLSCFSIDENDNGHRFWITDSFDREVWTSPAVSNGYVITSWKDGFVRGFDAETGEMVTNVFGFIGSSPVISGDYCFISDTQSHLHIIDYKKNQEAQDLKLGNENGNPPIYTQNRANSPIIVDGYLYFINTFGHLYKLEPAPKGRITINKPSVTTTTIDPFSYEIILENTRTKEESSHVNLELQLEYDINDSTKLLPHIELEPGESRTIHLNGVGNQFPKAGEYKLDIRFKINNAHELDIVWGNKIETWKKSDPLSEAKLPFENKQLLVNIQDPAPCLEVENTIDLGDIWDDEISLKTHTLKLNNPCNGTLFLRVDSDYGIIIEEKDEFSIHGKSNDTLLFRLDDAFINKPGEHELGITLNGHRVKEQWVTIKFNIIPSKSIVVVQIGSTRATVNGKVSTLDAPPYITQGTTMVPLRFVSEGLGFDKPEWRAEIKTIIIHLGNERYLRLVLGYSMAIIEEPDGSLSKKDLAVAPEIKNGRTFVPLRFIGEIVGATVDWNGETKEVTLTRSLKP
jgi:outer membrane protein assembly factor BamB